VVGLAFGGWTAYGAIFGAKEVQVPTLIGLTRAEAAEKADEAGFKLTVTDEKRDPEVEEGDIISQSPDDGLLLEGKAISVVVSKGPPLVKVPNFTGMKLEKAEARLEKLGLERGAVTSEYSLEFDKGEIIEQSRSRTKLEPGESVGFLVSKGPRMFEVPDVVNLKKDKAEAELEAAGFNVTFVDVYSDDIDAGRVVSTNPGAGVEAPEAGTIEVAISLGPQFEDVNMPDVRGMHVDDARALLEGKGFSVRKSQSCPGTTVQETDPRSGEKVKENATVTLFVCG
jgi:serine/threonine-protein kinase